MTTAYLALGSNLGDRLAHLRAGVSDIAALPAMSVQRVSDVYQTAPVGGPEQDDYLNAVAAVETDLSPVALLKACHDIEARHGRTRDQHWGARTLDLDVLAYGAHESTGMLELPHPRAHERAFVLVPWVQVAPDFVIPGHGTVAQLAQQVDTVGVAWHCPAAELMAQARA